MFTPASEQCSPKSLFSRLSLRWGSIKQAEDILWSLVFFFLKRMRRLTSNLFSTASTTTQTMRLDTCTSTLSPWRSWSRSGSSSRPFFWLWLSSRNRLWGQVHTSRRKHTDFLIPPIAIHIVGWRFMSNANMSGTWNCICEQQIGSRKAILEYFQWDKDSWGSRIRECFLLFLICFVSVLVQKERCSIVPKKNLCVWLQCNEWFPPQKFPCCFRLFVLGSLSVNVNYCAWLMCIMWCYYFSDSVLWGSFCSTSVPTTFSMLLSLFHGKFLRRMGVGCNSILTNQNGMLHWIRGITQGTTVGIAPRWSLYNIDLMRQKVKRGFKIV